MDQAVIATAARKTRLVLIAPQAFLTASGRTPAQHPQRHWRIVGVDAVYVPRSTSDLSTGGAATHGNILRRTITMGEPQQMHRNCGRGAGAVGAPGGGLNTNNFNSEIMRLLLGCKKPKLRERRNPLGNTCCNTSHKKATPLTLR